MVYIAGTFSNQRKILLLNFNHWILLTLTKVLPTSSTNGDFKIIFEMRYSI